MTTREERYHRRCRDSLIHELLNSALCKVMKNCRPDLVRCVGQDAL
jgi:hypothetical protein